MDGREAASPGTKKSIEPAALLLVLHVRREGHCNVSDNAAEKVWRMKTAAPSGVLSSPMRYTLAGRILSFGS